MPNGDDVREEKRNIINLIMPSDLQEKHARNATNHVWDKKIKIEVLSDAEEPTKNKSMNGRKQKNGRKMHIETAHCLTHQ